MSEEKHSLFGKLGVADFFVVALGASACSNVASLFTRDPQTLIYLGYSAMLIGALLSRYIVVIVLRYIDENFGDNPKKSVLVRVAYAILLVLFFAAYFVAKSALQDHIGRHA